MAGISGASMGPRRFRRGCHERFLKMPRQITLQWGRDVSVADVWNADAARVIRRRASMGPRRFRRGCRDELNFDHEDLSVLQWGRDVSVADVRARGRRHRCNLVRFNGAATFPSRMFTVPLISPPPTPGLQWGRDVSVADVPTWPSSCRTARLLQWGRDVSVADVRAAQREDARVGRLQWGRDVSVADVGGGGGQQGSVIAQLQWGRDVSVADVPDRAAHRIKDGAASMGPRRFRRGCATMCPEAAAETALLQWGRDVSVADVGAFYIDLGLATEELQWGRDVSVADVAAAVELMRKLDIVLQWGRDVSVADVIGREPRGSA